MAHLHSVLILGPDAVAAASPATAVQLVHACHRWGFSTVVPSSWGDELLASEVIRRCSTRDNRPVVQCSCPRVAERLAPNAAKLEDSIFWLSPPPVAAARYIRAHSPGQDIHITYAGTCPGALDACIDQRMSPTELLLAIGARGIDVGAQPTIFENIIPPDRRRYHSGAGGTPDVQRLWEAAAFRLAQPADIDLSIGIAQLLLSDDRVLIDMAPLVGCVCRSEPTAADSTMILRSPTPIVRDGVVEVGRSAPLAPARGVEPRHEATDAPVSPAVDEAPGYAGVVRRNSPARPVLRRQSAWKRQTPRPGGVVARPSAVVITVREPFAVLKRTDVRVALATAAAVASVAIGFWLGRR